MSVSLAAGRLLENQLWGVGPHDPVTLLASIGLVGVVALAASYLPARRAARVDPLVTLRQGVTTTVMRLRLAAGLVHRR